MMSDTSASDLPAREEHTRPPAEPDESHRLLAEFAHELSRPLAGVLNYAELALQEPELSPTAKARLVRVVAEAERCREVMHHFLELGRPAQRYAEPVDLNAIARQAVAAVGEPPARVTLDLAPELPGVAGDPRDLAAVVRNLVENAVHAAAGAADPEVCVATAALPGAVRLTVSDNGPGVPEALAERVFRPFFTTKPAGQGAGLGLAIARRIVGEHEGRLDVERSAFGGAAFVVELPAATSDAPPVSDAPTGDGRRVLVVDDDASMRKLLVAYLEGLGYEAVEAGNGREAIEAARREGFEAIICDMKMPEMNGDELYRALQAASPAQAERIIFATGVLPTDERDAFLRSLPNVRLRKPFRLAALRAALGRVRGSGTGSPAASAP